MSSTPIYDELAATYLADLTPTSREQAPPAQPVQAPDPAAEPQRPAKARKRREV